MARRAFCSRHSLLRATTAASFRPVSRKVLTGSKQLIEAAGVRACTTKVTERPFVFHPAISAGVNVAQVHEGEYSIDVTFDNGSTSAFPFVWLRDNCQCPSCFDADSSSRRFLLENLNVKEYALSVQSTSAGVRVTWSDGHESEYTADWLHQRVFTAAARSDYAKFHALTQIPWGAGHEFDRFSFDELVSDDKRLLEWLVVMEKTGVSLVTNMPEDLGVCQLIEHVAFVRKTHYGYDFHVENRPSANNLAFTSAKLGLHNDLAYYEYIPGMIMLQCLKQHEGSGGETQVSDGLFAAEYLRQHHPEAHRVLRTLPMYFWDKGTAGVPSESPRFYKLSKAPVLHYDDSGNLMAVRISQHSRDSCMPIPAEDVQPFYAAMRLFYDVMETNSITYRMKSGDMVALDNRRCQHGRLAFEATSTRHLVSAYLDLDEARCRRRELQDRLGAFHLQ